MRVCLNVSGGPGGDTETVPGAVPTEVQCEHSWERRWQHCVLLQKWQQEFHGTLYCLSAGIWQVKQLNHFMHACPVGQ